VTGPPATGVLEALAALQRALEDLDAPSMILGGIAVIARGVPRLTVDIDATVWGESVALEELFTSLAAQDIRPRIPEAEEFARRRQVLLLVHTPSGTPLEVSVGWLPFEREAILRAETVDFGGVPISVARPEDLIVYKAVAWRPRDQEDVERLLVLHGDQIDLDRVRELVRQFADALGEHERFREFEALVRRTLGR